MFMKAPRKPLPASYRPTGGVPHKVGNQDGWWKLGAKHGVDPWWLIQYNFETRDPAEVNWYLKNRVGCTRTTVAGKNFRFSASDSPGIIYVPTPQMARSLKSLKYGRYGIVVEGGDDYKRRIGWTLDWIARSDTGMVLLRAIRRTGKEITIGPYKGNQCNAFAGALDDRKSTAAGELVMSGDMPKTEESFIRDLLDLPQEPLVGTGEGSDARVRFNASNFGYNAGGACAGMGIAGQPGASPSQVLFHELAHAYRQAAGRSNRRPTVGGSAGYTNMEEFFAIVMTNVFIADPTYSSGNRTLRADHNGFVALAPTLSTSRGFVSHVPNRNKMRELVSAEPEITKEMKSVKSYFNPFVESL